MNSTLAYNKLSRRYKEIPLEKLSIDRGKASDKDGWIEGYLAVYGNVDHDHERIQYGAFAKTIQERVPKGEIPLMVKHMAHGGDVMEVVGIITHAEEHQKGLWVHADFLSDATSQAVREKAVKKAVRGLSVGYNVIRWAAAKDPDGRDIVDLLELRLIEGTVTVKPVNELAQIYKAKALDEPSASTLLAEIISHNGKSKLSPEDLEKLEELKAKLDEELPESDSIVSSPPKPDISGLGRELVMSELDEFLTINS